jgi:hypothetical protein
MIIRRFATMCSVVLVSAAAFAQSTTPVDIFASVAATRVFRAEDTSFGTVVSGGAGIEWRPVARLGLGVEVNRTAGLTPRVVDCGSYPGQACSGRARSGVEGVTLFSATAAWYFGSTSVRPYVIGGIDVMWSRGYSSVTFATPPIRIEEWASDDRGFGITAGFGVRIPVGTHVVIRPEWRIYDGSLMGRANLAAMRTSVAIGYRY